MSDKRLSKEKLFELQEDADLDELTHTDIERLIRQEEDLQDYLPDQKWSIDPRDGTRILYSSVRAKRPVQVPGKTTNKAKKSACPICSGKTTKIIDSARLTKGYTFINKNLFPVLYPFKTKDSKDIPKGMHFLQWTTNYHDVDWETLPVQDGVTVFERTALLENKLLKGKRHEQPQQEYIIYIKNCGKMVGSSLPHDHQQLLYSTIPPARYAQHKRFFADQGQYFSEYLLESTPKELIVKKYNTGTLLVPYFMMRAYELSYVVNDTTKRYFHKLTKEELEDLALVMKEVIGLYKRVLPGMGLPVAYNVIFHIDSETGLYVDFLPFTQHHGGLEKLGLYVCQADPVQNAKEIKEMLHE